MVDLETEPVELGGGGIKSAYINGLSPSLSLSLSLSVCSIQSIDRMIDWIVLLFYAVSAIFQPHNGSSF